MIEIEVCERLMDYRLVPKKDKNGDIIVLSGQVEYTRGPKYHAQIKNEDGYWSCGDTASEAIGNLMCTHPQRFQVLFTILGKKAR